MSDRHDLRRQTREIHESLSRFDREQLVDILTHIFRIYVMEGAALAPPPPPSIGDELSGVSFAQLIERLQLRLDLPELALFEVQGSRVCVRVDGRLIPLESPAGRAEPPAPARPAPPVSAQATAASPAAASAPPAEPRPSAPPAPGVIPAGHAGAGRPEAARPSGVRVSGTPAAGAASAPPPGRVGPAAPSPAAPAPAPAARPENKADNKPAEEGSQGGRFGLLEID